MATPHKVTPAVAAEMLRLWHTGLSQQAIAKALVINKTTVTGHLRKLLGVSTPDWQGKGRVSIRRIGPGQPIRAPVYPDNPTKLSTPCEVYIGEANHFWSHVAPVNDQGCRLWVAPLDVNGRGYFGKDVSSRVSWRLAYGPIPNGQQVNHRCDVGTCMEPTHFWLRTQLQNMHDMHTKGRATSKLDWPDVRRMRHLRETKGLALYELAKMFGISTAQCSNICAYKQWIE